MVGLVYTANIGDYDVERDFGLKEDGIEYRTMYGGSGTRLLEARRVKVITPIIYPEYDWYLWLDATMEIKKPISGLIDSLMASEHHFAAFDHNEWQCSYTEIEKCIERKKDTKKNLNAARELITAGKLPRNFGQVATGVLWRRSSACVREHARDWWEDIDSTTPRDQATFMFNLWKKKIYYESIPGSHVKNKWFTYHGHQK